MSKEALPRPVTKYLNEVSPDVKAIVEPVVVRVYETLGQGADKNQVLEILAAHPVPGSKEELALLEALARLAHRLMPEILQAHFGFRGDKDTKKALKKAYHHLKAQGIEIPPELVKPDEGTVVKLVSSPALVKGYLSRIEGNGSRMVILQLPRQGQSFNLFLALVNDIDGIKDAYAVLLSNKETRKYLDNTRQEMPGELVEAPPAYVFKILEDCYQLNPDNSAEAVSAYLRVRPILQNRLGQDTPPVLEDLLPPLEEGDFFLEQSRDLSLEEDFLNWHFPPEEVAPWLEKIRDIENSPLVLSQDQKIARTERVIDEATRELFPPERRRLLSRRLLEMAYYLDRTGRPQLARQAQAAGADLERDRSLLERENPFIFGLLMFPLREMYEMEKEQGAEQSKSLGRIITDF